MRRLTLTYCGETVISDSFNFRAYRLIHGSLSRGGGYTGTALDSAAMEAVVSMFDGTALTEDVLLHSQEIDAGELMRACGAVLGWYMSVKIPAREKRLVGKLPDDPILHIYHHMLVNRGILPGDIDKQDPQLVFDVMASEDGDAVSAERIPPELRVFYGL